MRLNLSLLVILSAIMWFPLSAQAAKQNQLLGAVEVSKAVDTVETLHTALTDLMLSDETDLKARKALVGPALKETFDLPVMAKAIVGGRVWRASSEAQQNAAVAAFEDWMITQYASRFNKASDPDFAIRETRDGGLNTVMIETLLTTSKRSVSLDYRMRTSGETVKIIDVFLDGRVSEIALRKSDYAKLLREEGMDGFIAALGEKTSSLSTPG